MRLIGYRITSNILLMAVAMGKQNERCCLIDRNIGNIIKTAGRAFRNSEVTWVDTL